MLKRIHKAAILGAGTMAMLGLSVILVHADGAQKGAPSYAAVSSDYVEALRTTDIFLHAWMSRDVDGGIGVLSDRLKKQDHWKLYISGLSNPQHSAFEVGPGKKLPDGRYSFSVTFYTLANQASTGEKTRTAHILLAKTASGWLIDDLPEEGN